MIIQGSISYMAIPGLISNKSDEGILNSTWKIIISETGLSRKEIIEYDRRREHVEARQIICYILNRHTDMTLQKIGIQISRDHSSVIHSVNVIKNITSYDHVYATKIKRLETLILLNSGDTVNNNNIKLKENE